MICTDCRDRHHKDCKGGTWCDCQHQPETGLAPKTRNLFAEFTLHLTAGTPKTGIRHMAVSVDPATDKVSFFDRNWKDLS
jgi:hypothetical protein